jgi:hypothetical protein
MKDFFEISEYATDNNTEYMRKWKEAGEWYNKITYTKSIKIEDIDRPLTYENTGGFYETLATIMWAVTTGKKITVI